jgi:23S rRNA C2498 (ribose-2'-O)-methylase RlmM
MANEETKKLQSLSNFAKKMSVTLRETSKEQSILSADEFYLRKYRHVIEYTPEQVDDIIATGSLSEKHTLSRKFFEKNGLYKRIILYYATLLTY